MIISLSGRKGSGKDTVADMLTKHLPLPVRRVSFAAKLKQVCSTVFELPLEFFNERKEGNFVVPKEFPIEIQKHILQAYGLSTIYASLTIEDEVAANRFKSAREILQFVGTNFLRSFDTNVHLRDLPLGGPDQATVCTDCRFPNEINYLRVEARKRIMSFISVYIERGDMAPTDNHASEQLDSSLCDFVLSNDGSLDDLEEKIKKFVKEIV